ncbi:quinoprotein dehydrogenase-associated putative ABC transporter substrate-binding protein [Candidatus Methylopumilus rimovensis]|jgi:mxaJ protein|uniref:Quinoprotein dehydrogenase-associated putative ABC transporter substrate-binding protein n=1 Tax=Candidatus Methylopumilus rimovensis TaxID=2588535 RepID=A0AAE6KNU0_9PROT|nr:substrate-binding domain-containing protein [Candidatus Methylopumilus rimovensis]QDD13096.1 quinoprotein dehydrogenase-associated putative ABC transporter substrate-binding protein [Candidatus Methylopumilus rimovensis]
MFKKIILALCVLNLIQAGSVFALGQDREDGLPGMPYRTPTENEFRVCADPESLPYSNQKGEGFENKIAEVLAKDLGKELTYEFWLDRQGYLRNTINAQRCDVIIGMGSDVDSLRTSKPYYRSGYVFVYRKSSNYNIKDWDAEDLKKGIIGIVGESPPTIPLRDHDLMANARPYRLQRDLNLSPGHMIDDLVAGKIDVAIIWGPIGGYYAKQSKEPLVVVPVPEYKSVNVKGKEEWNISVAVRKKDKDRMEMIQGALDRNQAKILKILDDYGIPHKPIISGDKIGN